MLRVTVCGDGPIAHSVALVAAWMGHAVRIVVSDTESWADRLRGELPDGSRIEVPLQMVSTSASDCIPGSDIVLVCVGHCDIASALETIAPHVTARMLVGGVPGFGGFGIHARRVLPRQVSVFGLQRIPFVVASHRPGRSVRLSGIRRQTYVAAMPCDNALANSTLVGQVLGVLAVPVSHYINIELSPSNSIVNPARLYALFGDGTRSAGKAAAGAAGEVEFFTGWDEESSRALLRLDAELQSGCRSIPRDTSFVAPILFQYDADGVRTLTMRFRRLATLSNRPLAMPADDGLQELARNSPYFTEDIDYGLASIRRILGLAGASVPFMDEILRWRTGLGANADGQDMLKGMAAIAPFPDIETLVATLD